MCISKQKYVPAFLPQSRFCKVKATERIISVGERSGLPAQPRESAWLVTHRSLDVYDEDGSKDDQEREIAAKRKGYQTSSGHVLPHRHGTPDSPQTSHLKRGQAGRVWSLTVLPSQTDEETGPDLAESPSPVLASPYTLQCMNPSHSTAQLMGFLWLHVSWTFLKGL